MRILTLIKSTINFFLNVNCQIIYESIYYHRRLDAVVQGHVWLGFSSSYSQSSTHRGRTGSDHQHLSIDFADGPCYFYCVVISK